MGSTVQNVECFSCQRVSLLQEGAPRVCPSCGSANIALRSMDDVLKGFEAGAYFNIDPKTGKRAKDKKR